MPSGDTTRRPRTKLLPTNHLSPASSSRRFVTSALHISKEESLRRIYTFDSESTEPPTNESDDLLVLTPLKPLPWTPNCNDNEATGLEELQRYVFRCLNNKTMLPFSLQPIYKQSNTSVDIISPSNALLYIRRSYPLKSSKKKNIAICSSKQRLPFLRIK